MRRAKNPPKLPSAGNCPDCGLFRKSLHGHWNDHHLPTIGVRFPDGQTVLIRRSSSHQQFVCPRCCSLSTTPSYMKKHATKCTELPKPPRSRLGSPATSSANASLPLTRDMPQPPPSGQPAPRHQVDAATYQETRYGGPNQVGSSNLMGEGATGSGGNGASREEVPPSTSVGIMSCNAASAGPSFFQDHDIRQTPPFKFELPDLLYPESEEEPEVKQEDSHAQENPQDNVAATIPSTARNSSQTANPSISEVAQTNRRPRLPTGVILRQHPGVRIKRYIPVTSSVFNLPGSHLHRLLKERLERALRRFGIEANEDFNILCLWDPNDEWCTLRQWLPNRLDSGEAITDPDWTNLKKIMFSRRLELLSRSLTNKVIPVPKGQEGAATKQSAVDRFLSALRRPLLDPKAREILERSGIKSEDDLDAICQSPPYWDTLRRRFVEQGLSVFSWLLVKDGLRRRQKKVKKELG
ncbi:hypothetical protein K474DRAFT_1663434 [Panus rudis PR-1116 ss-1]|nr:hypothetical protein K474DRAFT_1663434 [Panus rudis PR-1116 ss-1]